MGKIVRVGLDFDGVVSYNPFRIIRAPIKWFKRKFRKTNKLSFFVPHTWWQTWIWILMHESSLIPARGATLLGEMCAREEIEVHLITGRFEFLEKNLTNFLRRYRMTTYFSSININKKREQPHLFKERMIKKLKLDYYVEDNWDIVQYLQGKTKAEIIWIYNYLDRQREYAKKYPYLETALKEVRNQLPEKIEVRSRIKLTKPALAKIETRG